MKIKIRKCTEPDDMNYGGWDMLVALPDGTYGCFGEVQDWDRVLSILNDPGCSYRPRLEQTISCMFGGLLDGTPLAW
jgi:hypothetical protein